MKNCDYVIEVIDGATFKIVSGKIMRLEKVAAPKLRFKKGNIAKEKLESLVLRKQIEYEEKDKDIFGMLIVQARINDKNINRAMSRFIKRLEGAVFVAKSKRS